MKFFGRSLKPLSAVWLKFGKAYDAAKYSRSTRSWFPSFGSPDGEIIRDLPLLRARSRDLCRNNAIAKGAIRLKVTNVIGRGLKMQSSIDRDTILEKLKAKGIDTTLLTDERFEVLENQVEKDFNRYAESNLSHAKGQRNLYDNMALAYQMHLESGEAFATTPLKPESIDPLFRLRLNLIEADQVQSPKGEAYTRNNRDGIETLNDGTPVGIWVNKNQEQSPKESVFIPYWGANSGRPLVFHLFKTDREGQTRGVPWISPVMGIIKDLGDYQKSERIRAKVVSFFSVFIKSANPHAAQSPIPENESDTQETGQGNQQEQSAGRDYKIAPAAVHKLLPDEDISFANPGNISSNYTPLSQALMVEIGMGLGIPFEILRRMFDASYSASRGAKAEFWKEIVVERAWFVLAFCKPFYREWLIERVLSGAYDMPGFFEDREIMEAYLDSMWTGEAMGLIDPTKEIEAANMRVAAGYSNFTEETAAITGGNYERNLRIAAKERKLREKYGQPDPIFLAPVSKTNTEIDAPNGNNEIIEDENEIENQIEEPARTGT